MLSVKKTKTFCILQVVILHETQMETTQCFLHKSPSFVYPPCAHFQAFLLVFQAAVLLSQRPVAFCSPLSPHEQTTLHQMDFLYTMPHCIISFFPNTFGGQKDHAMSRRIFMLRSLNCKQISLPPLPRRVDQRAALSSSCGWPEL